MLQKPKKPKTYIEESRKVLGVAFELGFIIALPITLFAFLGKYLNQKYHTSYFVYIGIALAVIFTSIWIYRRFALMVQDLEAAAQINKNTPKPPDKSE